MMRRLFAAEVSCDAGQPECTDTTERLDAGFGVGLDAARRKLPPADQAQQSRASLLP